MFEFKFFFLPILTFLLTAPHYFIFAIHHSYYKHRYGDDFSLIFAVSVLIFGTLLSIILIKYFIGTYFLLAAATLVIMFCSISLLLSSMLHFESRYSYEIGLIVASLAIGMVQPNLPAVVFDQYSGNNVFPKLIFAFINLVGVTAAILTSLAPQFIRLADIGCPMLNCYSVIYLMGTLSSCLALAILALMYCCARGYLTRPLFHSTFPPTDSQQLNVFIVIMVPLMGVITIFLLLEHEIFEQVINFDHHVHGRLTLHSFHMQMIYSILSLSGFVVAILMAIINLNSFHKILFGCCLICAATIYFGVMVSYNKKNFMIHQYDPRNPETVKFEIFNGDSEMQYQLMNGYIGVIPFEEMIGPFELWTNSVTLYQQYLVRPVKTKTLHFSFDNTSFGQLIIIPYFSTGYKMYAERFYRVPSGFVLLRLLFNSIKTKTVAAVNVVVLGPYNITNNVSLRNNTLMEIPGGHYNFSINKILFGPYHLKNGGYYTFGIAQHAKLYHVIPFVRIPPFMLKIRSHTPIYVLLSLAKYLIYASALEVAYAAAPSNQSALYISWLYLMYFFGWILNRLIRDYIVIIDKMDVITVAILGFTMMFHCSYAGMGHRLNRGEERDKEV